jgi:lipid-binding SYLF domain-containing protein
MTKHFKITGLTGALATFVAFVLVQGSAVAGWDPKKIEARDDAVSKTLVEFSEEDASLERFFDEAAGYVVFPKVGKAAFVVGGSHGKGEAFEKDKSIGIAKMTAVSVGLSLGGQTFQEIIFFKSKEAFDQFKKGKFTLGADVKAVVVKTGAATESVWNGDIAAFIRGQKGAMVDASVNGQHLKFESH